MFRFLLFMFCIVCKEVDLIDGFVEIVLEVEVIEIDSWQIVDFVVMGIYEDGIEFDLSVEVDLVSSDEDVLVLGFFQIIMGYGIGDGVVMVSVFLGELEVEFVEIVVFIVVVEVGDFVINEVFVDDGDYDVNGDGDILDEVDEFIELINISFYIVDLSGVMVWDSNYVEIGFCYIFESLIYLLLGQVFVVFGGGSVDILLVEGVIFVVVVNDDMGLIYGLSLNNSGEYILLVNDQVVVFVNLVYGDEDDIGEIEIVDDVSINCSFDIVGFDYVDYWLVEGSIIVYSFGI